MKIADEAVRSALTDNNKASRERGKKRAREILETAKEILANEGYHNLTLRKIAQRMNISKGNLTYYYATKEILLQAIVTDNMRRYEMTFERESKTVPDDHSVRLRNLLGFLVDDANNPEVERFFYQVWALSTHNEDIANHKKKIYQHYFDNISTQLRLAYPDMPEDSLNKKCLLIMCMTEGMNVIFGCGEEFMQKFGDLENYLPGAMMEIIES